MLAAKTFTYTTPVLTIQSEHLSSHLLASQAYHCLVKPDVLQYMLSDMQDQRAALLNIEASFIAWEVAPPCCLADQLQAHVQATRDVDVFSPHHIELMKLLATEEEAPSDRQEHKDLAHNFLRLLGKDSRTLLLIRAGIQGCFYACTTVTLHWLL